MLWQGQRGVAYTGSSPEKTSKEKDLALDEGAVVRICWYR